MGLLTWGWGRSEWPLKIPIGGRFASTVLWYNFVLTSEVEVLHRHRLVHTHTHDRTRVHIKSIVGIEAHVCRAVLALAGLRHLCNTSERKQGGLIITGGEVQWHC